MSAYCLIYQKCLKGFYTSKSMNFEQQVFTLLMRVQKKSQYAVLAFENDRKM